MVWVQKYRSSIYSMRAAACSDGRRPGVTNVVGSVIVENIDSRGY